MNIALLGYGKMGKEIESIAIERGHHIVIKTDINNPTCNIKQADIAINFSTPDSAFENIVMCFENGIPVVSGTTGWLEKYEDAVNICKTNNAGFIYASNFSLGVNLFFGLNEYLAKIICKTENYKASILDIHHTQKLDAPSGTAITLAEDIIDNSNRYNSWELTEKNTPPNKDSIPIESERIGQVTGTHKITYSSKIDDIKIEHIAHNRKGFALGSVVAAEWLKGRSGVFSMKDVLQL